MARRRPARPLRLPALAVLRADPRARRLSRGAPARPGDQRPDACRRGDAEAARSAAADPRRLPGRGRPARRPCAGSRARWSGPRTGSTRRRSATTRSSTCARTRPSPSSWTSSRPGSTSAARSPARRSSARSSGRTLRLARGDEPGRVAVTDLLRARTRRTEVVFLLGLEEGSLPAPLAGLAVHRRRGAPLDRRALPAGAPGQAGLGLARALLLLHRVHAPVAAPLPRPRGGERRGLAARAEPVLGRGARALRRRATSPAGRSGGRSRRSPGGWTRRRPSASGSGR